MAISPSPARSSTNSTPTASPWADYFEDVPQDGSFRPTDTTHNLPMATFFLEAAGVGTLPQVSFVDPNLGTLGTALEDDEHPPTDIQRRQHHVSQIVNAVRHGPFWKDSIIFILYDEHDRFYDHAKPPRAWQNGTRTPHGIFPGNAKIYRCRLSASNRGKGLSVRRTS